MPRARGSSEPVLEVALSVEADAAGARVERYEHYLRADDGPPVTASAQFVTPASPVSRWA